MVLNFKPTLKILKTPKTMKQWKMKHFQGIILENETWLKI